MIQLIHATSTLHIEAVKDLFREYASALGFDLDFQDFERELTLLPGSYAPPDGCLLLALFDDKAAGCGAIRKIAGDVSEMKKLYVRPQFRRNGIGRLLALDIIERARAAGYAKMRLDTVPWMREAIALYRSLGFKETTPYRYNPIEGALFLELDLSTCRR
jgi:putative acetyltransferase